MNKVADFIKSLPFDSAEIASRSGIPESRIEAIVQGEKAKLDELRAIAKGLRIPLRSFVEPGKIKKDLSLLFRQSPGARVDLGVDAIEEFVSAALEILPKKSDLPNWITSIDAPSVDYIGAVKLADQFRATHVGPTPDPIIDLPNLLVDLGGLILARLETSRYEGASLIADGYAFIFVSPRFSGRMLFTLAHELGHLLAHHRDKRSAIFDLSSQIGGERHSSKAEAFVDAFASNLLMPEEGVGMFLRQMRQSLKIENGPLGHIEILYLAIFYGVSFEVAARRCEQLELLPKGGAYSLANYLKKNNGSAEKLADELGLPKRESVNFPQVSKNLIEVAAEKIRSGEISIGWATDKFGCSANDIYEIQAKEEIASGYRH